MVSAVAFKPVGTLNVWKGASLWSASVPLETRIRALAVFRVEGTYQLYRVAVAAIVEEMVVQVVPPSTEYCRVCVPVTPGLFQVMYSYVAGASDSPPFG